MARRRQISISLFCLVLRLSQAALCGDLVGRLGAPCGRRTLGISNRPRSRLLGEPESRIQKSAAQTCPKEALSGLRIRKGGLEGRFELLRRRRGDRLACSRRLRPCVLHQFGDGVALLFRDPSNLFSVESLSWRTQTHT